MLTLSPECLRAAHARPAPCPPVPKPISTLTSVRSAIWVICLLSNWVRTTLTGVEMVKRQNCLPPCPEKMGVVFAFFFLFSFSDLVSLRPV